MSGRKKTSPAAVSPEFQQAFAKAAVGALGEAVSKKTGFATIDSAREVAQRALDDFKTASQRASADLKAALTKAELEHNMSPKLVGGKVRLETWVEPQVLKDVIAGLNAVADDAALAERLWGAGHEAVVGTNDDGSQRRLATIGFRRADIRLFCGNLQRLVDEVEPASASAIDFFGEFGEGADE